MEKELESFLFFRSITEICSQYKKGLLVCALKCLYLNAFALACSLLLLIKEQPCQEHAPAVSY